MPDADAAAFSPGSQTAKKTGDDGYVKWGWWVSL